MSSVKSWLRPSLNNLSCGINNPLQDRNVRNFVTCMIDGGCMSIDKSLLRMKRANRSVFHRRAFQHFTEDIARPRETSFVTRRECPGQCLKSEIPVTKEEHQEFHRCLRILLLSDKRNVLFTRLRNDRHLSSYWNVNWIYEGHSILHYWALVHYVTFGSRYLQFVKTSDFISVRCTIFKYPQ